MYEEVSEGEKKRSWISNKNRFVADAKTEVDAEAEARADAEAETEVEADVPTKKGARPKELTKVEECKTRFIL